jgi:two-component system sensor histidine kinase and response regulator WspE
VHLVSAGGSDPFGAGGFSLFDLFKGEAETHCRVLNDGLLALEAKPDDLTAVEPLMRAAHSMKGAARIIGLDVAVKLAHAMEDVLVAAQKGRERLGSPRIDQLLRGTDLLAKLATITEADLPAWTDGHGAEIDGLCAALAAAPPASAPPAVAAPAAPAPEAPSPAPSPAPASAPAATPSEPKTVRLSADSIDRIMRLAGEMTVESRRYEPLRERLHSLKERLLDLDESLEALGQEIGAHPRLDDAAKRTRSLCRDAAWQLLASDELARRVEENAASLYHATLGSRMRPFGDITHGYARLVRDIAKQLGKQVALTIAGTSVPVDRDILARLEAPLNHMIRNAVDHGIEMPEDRVAAGKPTGGSIRLEARHHAGQLVVQLVDDGKGVDPERVRQKVVAKGLASAEMAANLSHAEILEFLFLPGFSTAANVTEISGRGVGLDVVQSTAAELGGTATIDSAKGRGTTFRLELPLTLSVVRAAVVEIAGEPYAFPLSRLERVVKMPRSALTTVEGKQHFLLDGVSVGTVDAAPLLGFGADEVGDSVCVMVVAHRRGGDSERYGLVVSRFRGESDLVVRRLDERLGRVPHIASAAVLESGELLLVVDVDDLVQSVRQLLSEGRLRGTRVRGHAEARRRRRVLVVDDSITVRESRAAAACCAAWATRWTSRSTARDGLTARCARVGLRPRSSPTSTCPA